MAMSAGRETARLRETPSEKASVTTSPFGAAHRRTLEALCRTLLPDHADPAGLADACAAALAEGVTEEEVRQVRLALTLLDSRLANGLVAGRLRRLRDLDTQGREAILCAWASSRLAPLRAGFQALKRLVLFLAYSLRDPATGGNPHWVAVGYPGPPPALPPAPRPLSPLAIDADTTLDADAVVIGSGAGGGVVAAELAAAGKQVVILEKGGYFHAADFDGAERTGMQRLYEKQGMLATRDAGVIVLAGSTVGGGTTVNWMTSLRTPDHVLRQWERECGITGAAGPEWQASLDAVCDRLGVNTCESTPNGQNRRLIAGCEARGYHWRVLPRNARGCRDCGHCCFGCRFGAKQDVRTTFLHDACGRGAVLVAGCHVERVSIRSGAAAGVEAVANGHRLRVRAPVVVCAGGSIHTPALLLRSGLRNRNVGRHLHLHPVAAVFGLYDEPVAGWRGAIQTAACDQFADLGGGYGFVIEVAPVHPGLAALGLPWRGAAGHRDLMRRLDRLALFIAITRDRDGGRVWIDRRGRPVIDYTVSSRDAPHVLRGGAEAVRLHAAAGARLIGGPCNNLPEIDPQKAGKVEDHVRRFTARGPVKNDMVLFSAHQMSSCRMGSDPRRAPVRPDGQTWEVRNLFIADGSALPTATGVNPMISIMALAHRNAQVIKSI
jgi:choline dehydrogenase-like flavoprotein